MIRPYRKEDMKTICGIAKRAYAGIFRGFAQQIGKEALEIWMPDAANSRTAQLTWMAENHPEWISCGIGSERSGKKRFDFRQRLA